jgi:diguanylate cyclase (GGDEF)-like protein/PAS domain S-box-containing protein
MHEGKNQNTDGDRAIMKNYQEFYSNILDNISSGVYFVDRDRVITYWNKGAERLSGFTALEVVGSKCSSFLNHIDEKGNVLCGDNCPLLGTINDGNHRQAEVLMMNKMGQRVPVLVQAMPMQENGEILGAVEIFQDISPLKLAEARIRELSDVAFIDPLTQVYNRAGLDKIMQTWFHDFLLFNYSFSVIFIDVDQFKQVNDQYGHLIGDQILASIGSRLKQELRQVDIVGRWGGDEFVVLLNDVSSQTIQNVIQKIRDILNSQPYQTSIGELLVTCSSGGVIPNTSDTLETLMMRADQLMYTEKQTKSNPS